MNPSDNLHSIVLPELNQAPEQPLDAEQGAESPLEADQTTELPLLAECSSTQQPAEPAHPEQANEQEP